MSEVATPSFGELKNKTKREELYQKLKREKAAAKRQNREKRKKEAEELGDQAPPKLIPKTIENTREFDETIVDADDEEVAEDEATDEFASYFSGERIPKILITTSPKPVGLTFKFIEDLKMVFPNSEYIPRKKYDIKEIIEFANNRQYTDMILINEDNKEPNGFVLSHLPNGPTAHFKLSSIKLAKEIRNHARPSDHRPELIINNFNTRLGHTIGRMFAATLPHDPEFEGRRVVTFHNQRDFIFFRQHRYIFKNAKKTGLQEIGPRFTLKLRTLQKGTFDSKFAEYEWIHKKNEMDTSRRRFFL